MASSMFHRSSRVILTVMTLILPTSAEMQAESAPTDAAGKVYFVCRSQHEAPLGHRIIEFHAPDVLGWFQRHWLDPKQQKELRLRSADDGMPDWSHERTKQLLKGSVYGFEEVWLAMAKWGDTPPKDYAELKHFVGTIDYYGESITYRDHAIQCVTDDDEIDIAWHLFDEEFAKAYPERVAFLLHKDWKVDVQAAAEGSKPAEANGTLLNEAPNDEAKLKEGAVYCVFLSAHDGMTISEITGTFRFEGVRLPEFGNFLRTATVPVKDTQWSWKEATWPAELILVRALLQTTEEKHLGRVLSQANPDFLNARLGAAGAAANWRFSSKKPELLIGDRQASARDWKLFEAYLQGERKQGRTHWLDRMQPPLVQSSEHFCQIRFLLRSTSSGSGKDPDRISGTWAYLFFDDIWAAAHPELAQSILHYGSGWQVLYQGNLVKQTR
jgi:hypothetical protein